MYDRVLIPTDGSDHAIRAARHGLWLADVFDADVDVVHVLDTTTVAGPFDAGGVSEEYLDELEAERRELLREVAALAPSPEAVETTILHGRPSEQILEYAAEHDVDLVAMGTRGQTGLERYLIGSVAERVVRESPVPVLTAESAGESVTVDGYSEVMVPTDGSDAAEAAIDHATAIASPTDARVHGVSVIEKGTATLGKMLTHAGDVHDQLETAGETATETVAREARDEGLDAARAVREGRPGQTLTDYAQDHDVDLVVMGTHGRSGIERALVGSTAEWLVRHTEIPVLTVPQHED